MFVTKKPTIYFVSYSLSSIFASEGRHIFPIHPHEDGKIEEKWKQQQYKNMETFCNQVGEDKEWLIILISAFVSFFLIARLMRKYMKKELKQLNLQLLFPLGAAWFLVSVFFYLPLNTLYMNFDDFYTRLRGQEYTAVADYHWETIKVRSGRTSYPYYETVRRYSFTFVADNGVTTSLDQGLANFSEYDNAEQGDKFTVSYLPQVHKLSIVNKANDYDNLLAMGVSILLLILLVALLMGKLNFLYTMWRKFRTR